MEILSGDGAAYRTRLLTRPHAEAFARCLRANSRYADVAICESPRAQNPIRRFFVRFRPSQEGRAAALLTRQQAARLQRAHTTASGYLSVRSECGRFYYLLNLGSGEVYETHPRGVCTCPDYEIRCRKAGIECKHPEILRIHLRYGWTEGFQPALRVRRR